MWGKLTDTEVKENLRLVLLMAMMTQLNKLCNKTFSLPLEEVSLFNLFASLRLIVDEM